MTNQVNERHYKHDIKIRAPNTFDYLPFLIGSHCTAIDLSLPPLNLRQMCAGLTVIESQTDVGTMLKSTALLGCLSCMQ